MKSIRVALAAFLALSASPAFAQDIYHVGRDTSAAVNVGQTVLVDPSTGTRIGSAANPIPMASTTGGTPGAAAPATASQVAGTDGTNLRVLKTDASGDLIAVGGVAAGGSDALAPVKVGGRYTATLPTLTDGKVGDAQLDTRGNLHVTLFGQEQNIGAAVAQAPSDGASNNAAGLQVYSRPQVYNGTTWDKQRTITGVDGTGLGIPAVEQGGAAFSNITSATTTTVKSGAGTLHKVCINTFVASGTITIYNNTAGSGTKIGTITTPGTLLTEGPVCAVYDIYFSTGLTLVTTGTQDITVAYR